MNYSLDAGPLIAYLNNETGAGQTEDVLTEPGSRCHIHFMNLCEIYYLYYRRRGAGVADAIVQDLLDMGLILHDDHDEAFWKAAASFKGRYALSLPDAFCIALAQRIGGTVVTTDHAEFDPLVGLGYCPIQFVRKSDD